MLFYKLAYFSGGEDSTDISWCIQAHTMVDPLTCHKHAGIFIMVHITFSPVHLINKSG